jgi:hypothetical protein
MKWLEKRDSVVQKLEMVLVELMVERVIELRKLEWHPEGEESHNGKARNCSRQSTWHNMWS